MEEEEYVDDSWERIKRYEGRYSEFENASRRLLWDMKLYNREVREFIAKSPGDDCFKNKKVQIRCQDSQNQDFLI